MNTDRTIAQLARPQHGLVTLIQLREAGVTRERLRSRVRVGALEVVHPRVFRIAGAPESEPQSVLAVCLAAGPRAIASHRTAARLWAIDITSPLVEVTVPRGRYRRLDFAAVHATDRRWGVTTRDGVPVVTPVRLVLELGASATAAEVELAVDEFVRRKLLTWPNLRAAREREARRGRRGLGAVARVLEERLLDALPTDSRLEVVMARLFRRAGLPAVELHPTLRIGGRRLVPDFVLREEKVIVEVDGYGFHGDRRSFESDRARDALLAGSGWLVLRFTWRQVVERQVEVLDRLRAVVRVRRPRVLDAEAVG